MWWWCVVAGFLVLCAVAAACMFYYRAKPTQLKERDDVDMLTHICADWPCDYGLESTNHPLTDTEACCIPTWAAARNWRLYIRFDDTHDL